MRSQGLWRGSLVSASSVVCIAALPQMALAQTGGLVGRYQIQRIGLYGSEYNQFTGPNDLRFSSISRAGQVLGVAQRFRNTFSSTSLGFDVWTWRNEGTVRVNFAGGIYDSPIGVRLGQVVASNQGLGVVGVSSIYAGSATAVGTEAWYFDGTSTRILGLSGGAYKGTGAAKVSIPDFINESGVVVGTSNRYSSSGAEIGRDAWVFSGGSSILIGLTGSDYTSMVGARTSRVVHLTEDGQVNGTTGRVSPSGGYLGQDCWVHAAGNTTRIGLTGTGYVGSDGSQFSEAVAHAPSGFVAGVTRRNGASQTFNQDAWVWDGATTTRVGLVGGPNTTSAGRQFSSIVGLTAGGVVVGHSARYASTGVQNGQDAWIASGLSTVRIGLVGVGFVSEAGQHSSQIAQYNSNGLVAGTSNRYSATGMANGSSAWVYDGQATVRVGLNTPDHMTSTGREDASISHMTQTNVVAGTSMRFTSTGDFNGRDAWLWSGSITQQVGLTGGAYTTAQGQQNSEIVSVFLNGRASGLSTRYSAQGVALGNDAWYWDSMNTRTIGLFGSPYQSSSGLRQDVLLLSSDGGPIVGTSARYSGNMRVGEDVWYFDPTTGVSSLVQGAVRVGDGFASATPRLLTTDGYLLGFYSYFGSSGTAIAESRGFVFRPDVGMIQLDALVAGGIGSLGWRTLFGPSGSVELQTIVGDGSWLAQGQGNSLFALTIPSPATGVLLGLGSMCIQRRRRRGICRII